MSMLDSPTVALPIVTPKRHRKRWGRKRTVLTLMGLLVGLPAVALAAAYLFGTITGSTTVIGTNAAVSIESVTQTATTGVGCVPNKSTDANGQVLDIQAKAYRVTVNGHAPDSSVALGSCTIALVVKNGVAGDAPASVSAAVDTMPRGWTFVASPASPATIDGGQTSTIVLTIAADGTVAEAVTPFTGRLNVNIPPTGA